MEFLFLFNVSISVQQNMKILKRSQVLKKSKFLEIVISPESDGKTFIELMEDSKEHAYYRNSPPRAFLEKGVLKICDKFAISIKFEKAPS